MAGRIPTAAAWGGIMPRDPAGWGRHWTHHPRGIWPVITNSPERKQPSRALRCRGSAEVGFTESAGATAWRTATGSRAGGAVAAAAAGAAEAVIGFLEESQNPQLVAVDAGVGLRGEVHDLRDGMTAVQARKESVSRVRDGAGR